ncbi:MAG: DUF192 domain-containing protein [Chloroflexota bacterium]
MRRCETFFCRLRGLTFRRSLGSDGGLLLIGGRESRVDAAIHMFFVFFPIAVVWLDAEGWVVDAKIAQPFQPLCVPAARAKDILEGPPDLIGRVRVGQRLCFIERLDA